MRRFPVTGSSRNIATAPPAAAPSRERFRRVFIRAPVFRKEFLLVFLQNHYQAGRGAFCLLDFRPPLTVGSALAGRVPCPKPVLDFTIGKFHIVPTEILAGVRSW